MSGVLILIVVALWAAIGFTLWKRLVRPHIQSSGRLIVATLALATIWFVGPVLDEILGAREFERTCSEIPENKFYGPVALGSGEFFDETGARRWNGIEELLAIIRSSKTWDQLFGNRETTIRLRTWPIPMMQNTSTEFERKTGKPIVAHFYRSSPGGWIKRQLDWGMHAPYQCPSRSYVPNYDGWIVFRAQ